MISVNGEWNEGFVFDIYIKHSERIGNDVFGNPHFKNDYSPIGGLLHAMKYNGHYNTSKEIVDMCYPAISEWLKDKHIDIVLPIPPTTEREFQHVVVISEMLAAKLGTYYSDEVLYNIGNRPVKSIAKEDRDMTGMIVKIKPAKLQCNILLVDDLYSSGTTANECVKVLRQDPLVNNIYYFALAKTK